MTVWNKHLMHILYIMIQKMLKMKNKSKENIICRLSPRLLTKETTIQTKQESKFRWEKMKGWPLKFMFLSVHTGNKDLVNQIRSVTMGAKMNQGAEGFPLIKRLAVSDHRPTLKTKEHYHWNIVWNLKKYSLMVSSKTSTGICFTSLSIQLSSFNPLLPEFIYGYIKK